MMRVFRLGVFSAAFTLVAVAGSSAFGQPVNFNRDVRPIFAKHCTVCHGGVKAASDLSFVYRDSVLGVVDIDDPGESELLRRLTTEDADERMPPPDHGPALKSADVAVIRRWIEQGAKWSEPWSFVPPREPPLPQVKHRDWARTKADALVLAAMEARGLAPSAPAEPHEWLRRVSFDLIGLPPTQEQWERFRREYEENAARAKERMVDELLQSEHFGERWASMWLDLARYADTYGFEKDPHRDIWPWRDWVIRAFNADMPYDQFTIKQLAGDLLPEPDRDDLLATAFHRNTQNNTEGGTDDEEFRMRAVLDRVNTTWTVWQATTFGCVQCHSHPYDPYRHEDYYRFVALFNNTEDCDQNDDFPKTRVVPAPAQQQRVVELERAMRQRREALNSAGVDLNGEMESWERMIPLELKPSHGTLEAEANGRIRAGGTLPVGVTYTIRFAAEDCTAFRLQIDPEHDDPTKLPERGAILSQLEVAWISPEGKRQPLKFQEVFADALAGPYDPQDSLQSNVGGVGGYPVLERARWAVFVLAEPFQVPSSDARRAGRFEFTMRQKAASNSGTQACTLRRFAWDSSVDPRWTQLAADAQRKEMWQAQRKDHQEWSSMGGVMVPVMRERLPEARRATRVFVRGNFASKGDIVEPGIPAVLAPRDGVPVTNRLELARWLVSDANPLAARVMANRLWARLFGRGIVVTEEDFGSSGSPPTHPELLDHLALRFSHHFHWSVKQFLKELVLSSTYGQTSRVTPQLAEADPHNVWYARGPRQRLTAEMIRDQALRVSGLLSEKIGGPPVFPPQPEGVWRTVYSGAKWKTSTGPDRYRRAIYTYFRRTAGYPALLIFDAPTRDACVARRIPTNTPLQALVTLNDPAFFEMDQALAKWMAGAAETPEEQIRAGYRRLFLAEPPAGVVDELIGLRNRARKLYVADTTLSKKVADTPEQAALVIVANALLNLDAAMVR